MNRILRLSPLLLLAMLSAGCSLLFPPSAVDTALARCELNADPIPIWTQASERLIDAAEAGTLDLASDRWFVGYAMDASAPGAASNRSSSGLPGASTAALVRRAYGLQIARTLAPGLELVRPSSDPIGTARRLLADERVRYVHPDVAITPAQIGDDPLLGDQWHLVDFGLREAWAIEDGEASDVVVAVLDTGFDLGHPDLAGRLLDGWDFFDGDGDPSIGVASSPVHGTHVAGIVAAVGGNGQGVSGVAPRGVKVLPVKIFDDAGTTGTVDALTQALLWVAGEEVAGPPPLEGPVQIANLSLGTRGAFEVIPALEDAVRTARRAGVLTFAASGNDPAAAGDASDGVIAPANGPCAIAVASVDRDRGLSSFSRYDADERLVDLAGPGGFDELGDAILSTFPDTGTRPYGYLSGTSMSTPFVAGVAALLASHHPGWTSEEVLRALYEGAWLPTGNSPLQMGFGIPCPDALLGAATVCGD